MLFGNVAKWFNAAVCKTRLSLVRIQSLPPHYMVGVVKLANTSDCGSEDRGFKSRRSPHRYQSTFLDKNIKTQTATLNYGFDF